MREGRYGYEEEKWKKIGGAKGKGVALLFHLKEIHLL